MYVRPYKDIVYSIQYTVYSMQYAVYSMQYAVCSMQEQQQTYSLVRTYVHIHKSTHVYVRIHTQVHTYVHTYVLVQWFGTREMLSLSKYSGSFVLADYVHSNAHPPPPTPLTPLTLPLLSVPVVPV